MGHRCTQVVLDRIGVGWTTPESRWEKRVAQSSNGPVMFSMRDSLEFGVRGRASCGDENGCRAGLCSGHLDRVMGPQLTTDKDERYVRHSGVRPVAEGPARYPS